MSLGLIYVTRCPVRLEIEKYQASRAKRDSKKGRVQMLNGRNYSLKPRINET
jgi:hypothetical protein